MRYFIGHRAYTAFIQGYYIGKAIIQKLYQIDKRLKDYISFDSPLKNIDAIIANRQQQLQIF